MRSASTDIVYDEDGLGPLVRNYGRRGVGSDYDPDRPSQAWAMRALLVVAGIVIFGITLNIAKKYAGWDPRPPEVWMCLIPWMALAVATSCLIERRDARAVVLALHQQGFRYLGAPFLFADITAVRFGRRLTPLERILVAANRAFGRLKKANASMADALLAYQEGSLRIELRTGEERVLNGIRVSVRPEAMARFFEILEARRPGIVRWPGRSD